MEPVDYRNATWEAICGRVAGQRSTVYLALTTHGPCTTRELARRSGIDILSVRPRVTELVQLGWATIEETDGRGLEGTYRALPEAQARELFERRRAECVGLRVQGELKLA